MWTYNYTDTMYIGNDINNKNVTIIHSDIYLGKDYSDGIKHFKYIKREMVNGKWKYYYADDYKLKSGRQQLNAANANYRNEKRYRNSSAYGTFKSGLEDMAYHPIRYMTGNLTSPEVEKAKRARNDVRNRYRKEVIRSIPGRAAAGALNAGSNARDYIKSKYKGLASKSRDSINKGKAKISSLINRLRRR